MALSSSSVTPERAATEKFAESAASASLQRKTPPAPRPSPPHARRPRLRHEHTGHGIAGGGIAELAIGGTRRARHLHGDDEFALLQRRLEQAGERSRPPRCAAGRSRWCRQGRAPPPDSRRWGRYWPASPDGAPVAHAGSPMTEASSASAGTMSRTVCEAATAAWRVMAPMRTPSPSPRRPQGPECGRGPPACPAGQGAASGWAAGSGRRREPSLLQIAEEGDRIGDGGGALIIERIHDVSSLIPPPRAWHAPARCPEFRRWRGMGMVCVPSASVSALMTAGGAAMAPASPQPFMPSGLEGQRVSVMPTWKEGRSSARGIW